MELCGGTHVRATGDIGFFAIVAESGVAAGTRRIEAVTGLGALQWASSSGRRSTGSWTRCTSNPDQAVDAIEKLQGETKRLAREVTQLKTKVALGGGVRLDGRRHDRGRRREAGAAQGRRISTRTRCAASPIR